MPNFCHSYDWRRWKGAISHSADNIMGKTVTIKCNDLINIVNPKVIFASVIVDLYVCAAVISNPVWIKNKNNHTQHKLINLNFQESLFVPKIMALVITNPNPKLWISNCIGGDWELLIAFFRTIIKWWSVTDRITLLGKYSHASLPMKRV